MEIAKEKYFPHPREKANIFSILFFGYAIDTFKKGYRKTLELEDLYNPLKIDRSKVLGDDLQRNWERQVEKCKNSNAKPSLLKAIVATFWVEYLKMGIMVLCSDLVLRILQPLILGILLDNFKLGPEGVTDAYISAGLIVVINIGYLFLENQYMLDVMHGGMRIRAACCALMYRKALKLSKTALGDTASGKIVNLLSNDVSRFDLVSLFLHQMWAAPLASFIVMGLLYQKTGYAGIVGVSAIFLVVPIQGYTGKLQAKYRKQTALKTDERVRLTDEIVSGVQVIKMYAWEIPFKKIISFARRAEVKIITKSSYMRALYMAFNLFTTRFALFCTLLTLVLSSETITASRVFVIMTYFNFLSMSMSTMFTRGISEIAELIVAMRRIEEFLLSEEFDPTKKLSYTNGNVKNVDDFTDDIIILKDLVVKWNIYYTDNALENINLNIRDGHLIGIIGPVGSGKSSFLQTILGELEIVQGTMSIRGEVSYASQEPWIFAATVRQNILFGEEYDKKRYQEVVQVCALERDFEQFPNGDLTIVGDRGASLSGGQKARINLARAVYREADIYLLDDPLSAVDIHVSKVLYDKCINGYLSRRTRILVTHQVHYLKDADNLIILNNGKIEDQGTFNDLVNSDNIYAKLLTAEPENPEAEKKPDKYARQYSQVSRKTSIVSAMSELSIVDELLINDVDVGAEENEKEAEFNVKDLQEESSKGKVHGSILYQYMRSGLSVFSILLLIIMFLVAQTIASGVDYWVSYWVNIEENRLSNATDYSIPYFALIPSIELTTDNCLNIYGVFIAILFVLALIRSMFFFKSAMLSSKKLHAIIFDNVIGSTMRFFDTNPGGRILNRFSKDIGAIDELLPKVIMDSGQILLQMVGAFLLIVIINPYSLIMIAVLAVIFGFIRHIFLKSSKNIKRLEGIMRSPVFTHLKASIEGLTTIRAFGAERTLTQEFDNHQDYHSSAWYMYIVSSNAFGFYLDAFCAIFLAVLTFSLIVFGEALNMTGGEIGLAINQATALTGMLQWGMRQSAEVTNQLLSVERVLEYKTLPKEIQPAKPKPVAKNWPSQGEIVFTDMCLRYFEQGPLVLKHLSFTIKPKEKVGVVGRTGAGKSSIIQALFRLAPVEGGICIDEVDTKDISLEDLRLRISIIPQDPVLFSGTLRYNLDPFDEYSDDVLYKAIQDVELKDPANIINRLENRVMDRGANYSVGQRQLICLARAILKNNRVLMLDEATANVDPQTDALIQKTIRKKFVDCTVITVAHRLNTIMDSDKVLVMDAGQVAEFDHPHLLLQNKEGVFYNMVTDTGKATSEQLKKVASDSYQKTFALAE